MLIDCDTCAVRDVACHDCVVGVLLGTPTVPSPDVSTDAAAPAPPGAPLPVEFGPVERRALEVLADHGMIPRLRLVAPPTGDQAATGSSSQPRRARDAG